MLQRLGLVAAMAFDQPIECAVFYRSRARRVWTLLAPRYAVAPREAARARLLDRFPAAADAPSPVDELLAERRAEAGRKAADAEGSDEPA